MDPDACLQRARDAVRSGDMREAREALSDLWEWVSRGGFLPQGGIPAIEEVQALLD